MAENEILQNELLLGIDLGTSRTAVLSNRNYKHMTRSVVGYPKDIIGIKYLGQTQVFGDEALAKQSALSIYYPLADGVLREGSDQDFTAAAEFLKHVVEEAKQGSDQPVSGIIGVPARASQANKEHLLAIAKEILRVAMVVSEPFMVAYKLNKLSNCIIIDIGAGTIDLCGMKGTVPGPEDQVTLVKAGNYLDERLESALRQHHPEIQLTRNLVRTLKERHAFVGESKDAVMAAMRAAGKPCQVDISRELKTVCESIVPDIVEQVINILQTYDPEAQDEVLRNIYLAGGGSRIKGLDTMIAAKLSEYGDIVVRCVDDPDYIGCAGALKLATDLPPAYWDKIGAIVSH